MARAQKRYRLLKTAALVIQQRLRAWAVGRKQRLEYTALQRAALMLQSTWRGIRVRRQLQKEQECAVIIQAYYRMYVQQKKWKTRKKAARLIQVYYRTYRMGKKQRHWYLKTRAAAVVLQSAYRSLRVRKKIKEWNIAAITIQARYRAYKIRKKYATLRASAIVIQRWYRNIKVVDLQRKEYLNLKMTVTKMQAVYRGFRVRRQIQHMHLAATVIKAMFKMHQSKMRYQKLRAATVVIQVKYRAYYQGKRQRAKYLTILKAVSILQAGFRGARVRQNLRKMQVAATLIQSNYRRQRQQIQFTNLKKAVKTVQQRYRAIKERNRQFQRYNKLRQSVICIQAAYRGMKARRHLKVMHSAATLIQRRFRTQMMRRRFLSIRETTVWAQKKYRAKVCARHHVQQFLQLRRAAITIQASYRGWTVRKKVQEMSRAARLIQAAFRTHTVRVRYRALQHASVVIQQRYRANRASKLQRHHYLQQRHSALTLQAAFRGMKARRLLKAMHFSATLIQSRFRSLVMRKRFISFKTAAIFVQRKYRATVCARYHRHQFLELRKAVIVIQSSYQRLRVRKMLQEKHRAALLIQAAFRMYRTYIAFQTWKHAAILIQQHYRANRAAKLQRESYIRQRRSAVIIQATYRGMRARQLLRDMHRAAIIIQSAYRMHRQYSYYQDVQWATKVIQKKYRANQKQKALQCNALERTTGCTQAGLQDRVLRQQIHKEHHAAIIVQKHFKAYRTRKYYLHLRAAVVFVQRRYRAHATLRTQAAESVQSYGGWKVQRDAEHMHRAATLIQSFYRMHRARADYQAKKTGAVTIQNYCRSHARVQREREQFLATQKSIQTLQTACEGKLAGQKWENLPEEQMAATASHSAFSCDRAETQDEADQSSVVGSHRGDGKASLVAHSGETENHSHAVTTLKIFPTWDITLATQMEAAQRVQCFLQMVVHRRRFLQQKRAAITLQQYFRTWQARKQFLQYRKAAVILQSHFRASFYAKHQRKVYLQLRSSVIIIQARTKGFLQKRKFQKMKADAMQIQRHQAACLIQTCFRGYKERQVFLLQKSAAVTIQRHIRARQAGKHARLKYMKLKYSAVILQALVRGWLVRKRILEQQAKVKLLRFTAAAFCHLSAFKIQRAFKLYLAVKNAKKQIESIIYIQRWFRARLCQKRLIEKYRNIMKIEREAQERLRQQNQAALVIQKSIRRFLLRKKQERIINGIKKIQALWRGYALRKKNDCKKIKAIRLSLQVVNREIREENKLYRRSALALHYLLTYKHISAIIEALKHLEVVTRLSPLCCENMAQSGAISKIFILIRSCNRSVPCMEVIRYAVQVLLNVAKYEKTTSAIYTEENCIDTLLDLLQMYREKPGDRASDKGGSIFTKTCCLLAVLLKTTNRASDVRSRSKVVDRIYSLYRLTARKHKMNMERIHNKQRNSLTVSFIPETPVRTRVVSRLKPYWVLRRDKVEEITNSLQAIQMVMDTLGIPYQ